MEYEEIEQLFSLALQRELEAHEFYKDVSQRVENKGVSNIFAELAEQEMQHHDLIEKFKQDPTAIMRFQAPENDFHLAEISEMPRLSVSMKPADAIALAMKKEQQAVEFYRGLAGSTDDASMKDAFENLANMELAHKHQLEEAFVQIGYPEAF
jgi:rubrerythrin